MKFRFWRETNNPDYFFYEKEPLYKLSNGQFAKCRGLALFI
jgi:hypothetical protein